MFRPCIDVKDGKVVQLEQGERLALTDRRAPEELARLYRDDHLDGGHIIDLQGGRNREVILPALSYKNLQVGGGISEENGADYLDAGATHLIFSSAVFTEKGIAWESLGRLRSKFGRDRIVLAPDVRGKSREIHVKQWTVNTRIPLTPVLIEQLAEFASELLIHSIEVEGMEDGVDWRLVRFLAENRMMPITYAGGGTDLATVRKLHEFGLDMTIGKAYFSGRVAHEDLVRLNNKLADSPR